MKVKCIAVLIALCVVCLPSFSQTSQLAISNSDSSLFTLMVDNMNYGSPAKSFEAKNLAPGLHRIRMGKPARLSSNGPLTSETVYDNLIFIPDSSRVTAVSPERGRLNIVSIVPILQYLYGIITGNGNNGNTGNNGGIGTGTGGFPWPWPTINQGMNANDFEMLKASVRSKSFESAKLEICKQALFNNRVTSSQVAQLLDLMTFESTKLELAKFAYPRTVDKANYYIVNNAFTFGSSISELGEFIRGSGG